MKRNASICVCAAVLVILASSLFVAVRRARWTDKTTASADGASGGACTVIAEGGFRLKHFQFVDEMLGWGVTNTALWKTEDGGRSWLKVREAPIVHYGPSNYSSQATMWHVLFLDGR